MTKSKNIIEKIKESGVKQRPKSYFLIRRFLLWAGYGVCILLGAASFSVILFALQQTDDSLLSHLSHSRLELFLSILPFFWIVLLLAFLLASVLIFRRSNAGYKYQWPILWGFSTTSSIIIGALFYVLGGGEQLERAFAEKVTTYQSIDALKTKTWMNPEGGYLAGVLIKTSENTWKVIDYEGKSWDVDFSMAFISRRVRLESGFQVKLKGVVTATNHFKISEMRPWRGRHASNHENSQDSLHFY
jgi:tryptophan-rich sensory protein